MSKNFASIGAAEYIAPRHMQAICDTGNRLVAAFDPTSLSASSIAFPKSAFFTEFNRFDRHVAKLRRQNGSTVDHVSICSPNYLHDSHMRFLIIGTASVYSPYGGIRVYDVAAGRVPVRRPLI